MDFLLGGNPKCNGEGPAFPSLTDEAMKCVLLYPVMFSPFFLLCFIVSEVFCKKHGKGTAWREQGGRVVVAFRLRFSQVKIICLKRS